MNTRRDFLSVTVKGSAIAVATALLPRSGFSRKCIRHDWE